MRNNHINHLDSLGSQTLTYPIGVYFVFASKFLESFAVNGARSECRLKVKCYQHTKTSLLSSSCSRSLHERFPEV